MELLYHGFDGLVVSFQGQIDNRFFAALENAKSAAQKYCRDEFLEWGGIGMLVKESGARGRYVFIVRTAMPDAVWFLKKPNAFDPWGVRVSCNAFQLALHELAKTRACLLDALAAWKVDLRPDGESIGRVDYAIDFLAPEMTLDPSQLCDAFELQSSRSSLD